MTIRLIPVLAPLILGSCASSPPTRFFALDPVTPAAAAAGNRTGAASVPVKVEAVHIPPALGLRK